MRLLLQRVSHATVTIDGRETARIGRGFLIFVGVEAADTGEDASWLAGKVAKMRLFADVEGAMNLSLAEVAGEVLVVSQFTLLGDTRKGRRPSFVAAMAPGPAEELYDRTVTLARETGLPVATGRFRADMQVELVNDGPVTILVDTKKLF